MRRAVWSALLLSKSFLCRGSGFNSSVGAHRAIPRKLSLAPAPAVAAEVAEVRKLGGASVTAPARSEASCDPVTQLFRWLSAAAALRKARLCVCKFASLQVCEL